MNAWAFVLYAALIVGGCESATTTEGIALPGSAIVHVVICPQPSIGTKR